MHLNESEPTCKRHLEQLELKGSYHRTRVEFCDEILVIHVSLDLMQGLFVMQNAAGSNAIVTIDSTPNLSTHCTCYPDVVNTDESQTKTEL